MFAGRRDLLTLAAVVSAVFLGALDQTVIVATLPAIVADLQIPFDKIDQAAWIVAGYLLGYTVALPLMGRFADLRGRRTSFGLALALFAAGSLVCALAQTLPVLIGARLVQAAGGGALLPVAVAVVSDRHPPERRAMVIGAIGAVAEAGGVLGPLYGAAIVAWLSWRWIFWLNVPLALLLLAGAVAGLRDKARPAGRLDVAGAALAAAALALLIVGLAHEEVAPLGFDVRTILIVLSALTFVAFLAWELRAADPLLDLRLFRRAGFAAAIAGGFLLGCTLIVAMVDVPLYASTVLDASPSEGGLLLMRLTALIPVGAVLGGALAQRLGLPLPTGLGFLASAVGLAAMSRWGVAPDPRLLWLSLATAGFGFGLLIAPLSTAAVNLGGLAREASAAALFTVARLTGMTVGLSILTAWGLQRFDDLAGAIPLPLPLAGETTAQSQAKLVAYNQAILVAGAEVYRELFLSAGAVALLGIVTVWWLRQAGDAHDDVSRA